MRRKIAFALTGALLLSIICSCAAPGKEEKETTYQVYYREADLNLASGGDALRAEIVTLDGVDERDSQAMAYALMEKMVAGPADTTLRATLPTATQLLSVTVNRGMAVVDLSAAYGALSGINLTLADYATTLTLTQLPEILSVKITVRGQELAYRERQVFAARDVLLSPKGDVVASVPVTLYFCNSESQLSIERRTLDLYEGDTQVGAVVRALENGPEKDNLYPVMPEGFRVRSAWLEENVCYVNLSLAQLKNMSRITGLQNAIDSLRRSLCSLESVKEVRFLVDGEYARVYGAVKIGEPYSESSES